jgi:hypothetical protein
MLQNGSMRKPPAGEAQRQKVLALARNQQAWVMGRSLKLTGAQDTGQALQSAAYADFWNLAGPARQVVPDASI